MRKGFTPEDLPHWLEFEPQAFIAVIVNEIRQEMLASKFRVELIQKDLNIAGINLAQLEDIDVDTQSVSEICDHIVTSLSNMEDILNLALAYSQTHPPLD